MDMYQDPETPPPPGWPSGRHRDLEVYIHFPGRRIEYHLYYIISVFCLVEVAPGLVLVYLQSKVVMGVLLHYAPTCLIPYTTLFRRLVLTSGFVTYVDSLSEAFKYAWVNSMGIHSQHMLYHHLSNDPERIQTYNG